MKNKPSGEQAPEQSPAEVPQQSITVNDRSSTRGFSESSNDPSRRSVHNESGTYVNISNININVTIWVTVVLLITIAVALGGMIWMNGHLQVPQMPVKPALSTP